jgi:endonuclease-3
MNSDQHERIVSILYILDQTYDSNQSLLAYETPFQLLIAVSLSAQTTDNQVNRVTPELFNRYPDPYSMAEAEVSAIESIIHSTGFYKNKAKNCIAAAQTVRDKFNGTVPKRMEELIQIPGIGRKSAGVILHHIYHEPAIIVDTHFGRVVYRLGLTESKDPVSIEKDIAQIVDRARWSEFSMTANLHGRAVCHAKKPQCETCILLSLCPQKGASTS